MRSASKLAHSQQLHTHVNEPLGSGAGARARMPIAMPAIVRVSECVFYVITAPVRRCVAERMQIRAERLRTTLRRTEVHRTITTTTLAAAAFVTTPVRLCVRCAHA